MTITTNLYVNVQENTNKLVSDHYNEIKNIFSHEEKHYSDFKKMGFEKYRDIGDNIRESRAIRHQMNQPTWNNTREIFRDYFPQP